jgi:hypothetical protein
VRPLLLGMLVLGTVGLAAQQGQSDATLTQGPAVLPLIARVGEYVEQYYTRAQSLLALEEVTVQPLTRDLGLDGFARRLAYELRIEWDAGASEDNARIVRQLVSVNGRAPRAGEEPRCTDPRGISREPLAPLLPGQRGK